MYDRLMSVTNNYIYTLPISRPNALGLMFTFKNARVMRAIFCKPTKRAFARILQTFQSGPEPKYFYENDAKDRSYFFL